jgi:hypothetical protein
MDIEFPLPDAVEASVAAVAKFFGYENACATRPNKTCKSLFENAVSLELLDRQ